MKKRTRKIADKDFVAAVRANLEAVAQMVETAKKDGLRFQWDLSTDSDGVFKLKVFHASRDVDYYRSNVDAS